MASLASMIKAKIQPKVSVDQNIVHVNREKETFNNGVNEAANISNGLSAVLDPNVTSAPLSGADFLRPTGKDAKPKVSLF